MLRSRKHDDALHADMARSNNVNKWAHIVFARGAIMQHHLAARGWCTFYFHTMLDIRVCLRCGFFSWKGFGERESTDLRSIPGEVQLIMRFVGNSLPRRIHKELSACDSSIKTRPLSERQFMLAHYNNRQCPNCTTYPRCMVQGQCFTST